MPEMHAIGSLRPVYYFKDSSGHILLPPDDETIPYLKERLKHRGYDLFEADTLNKIDRLQKELQDQEYRKGQAALEREETRMAVARRTARERLLAKLVSSHTTNYEKDFIRNYLMLADDKKDKWRKHYSTYNQCYFQLRENDSMQSIKDFVDSVGNKDYTCKSCGKYRILKGHDKCMRCLCESTEGFAGLI